MLREPEPELMDSEEQALAYALADFSEPHDRFVALFRETFGELSVDGTVLDLGCGPADVTIRFARAFTACRIDGLDAGPNMLKLAGEAVRRHGLSDRIRLLNARLPGAVTPRLAYDAVISNSLLHHLADPMVLWEAIEAYAKPGAAVFVMDLMRPPSRPDLDDMVKRYADDEPEVLRKDFRNSLLAAYRVDEVRGQLERAGLAVLSVRSVGDRHLVVSGFAP
jgi:cyclopropane fatty-acyl-phospholipid synthase-like methyltransferase